MIATPFSAKPITIPPAGAPMDPFYVFYEQ
jgi:hypothetical protein